MLLTISQRIQAKPFIKWAGGKTQLIPHIQSNLNRCTSNFKSWTYIEPFIGGGAILFHVLANFQNLKKIIINDINPNLVKTYQALKLNPEALIENLQQIEQEYYHLSSPEMRKLFYLKKRQEFNQVNDYDGLKNTVLFLFLNRTCFNGLYRVNRKGLFNVPPGNYIKPKICDPSNLLAVHQSLQNVEILCGDFAQTLDYAQGDFVVYLDPPYKPIQNTSAFTAYTKDNFFDSDQFRLKKFCDDIDRQGGQFILSNSDVKNFDAENHFFDHLYQGYQIQRVKAKRSINSKGDRRGEISELLITNF